VGDVGRGLTDDQVAVEEALSKLTTTAPEAMDGPDSPYAHPAHRAVGALVRLIEDELVRAVP
jgi:hypothetical protein